MTSLSSVCERAGVSDATARRYLREWNPMRAPRGWHRFAPDELPDVLAFIENKRVRRCRNVFNSIPTEQP